MTARGFWARGIQTGPFPARYTDFVVKCFHLFTTSPIINLSLYIRRREGRSRGRKWEKGILQKWMRPMSFWPLGIQTGPFAACKADFVLKISTFLTFILGAPNSYYPRKRKKGNSRGWKWGKGNHTKVNETQGFSDHWAFKLGHLQPLKLILS